MNDPKNVSIVLLCVSASVLATVLAIMVFSPAPAKADSPVMGGDYIMVSGAYAENLELLYVIDRSEQKLNVYVLNISKGDLILKGTANLKLAFQRPR